MTYSRDKKGRFRPGESGNPNGRPQGSISRLAQTLQDAAAEILPLWIDAARKGDEEKQHFLLDRGLPRIKAQLPNLEIEVSGDSDASRIRNLFDSVAEGEISPSAAAEMTSLLASAARVEEVEQLRAEVEALKAVLKRRGKDRSRGRA